MATFLALWAGQNIAQKPSVFVHGFAQLCGAAYVDVAESTQLDAKLHPPLILRCQVVLLFLSVPLTTLSTASSSGCLSTPTSIACCQSFAQVEEVSLPAASMTSTPASSMLLMRQENVPSQAKENKTALGHDKLLMTAHSAGALRGLKNANVVTLHSADMLDNALGCIAHSSSELGEDVVDALIEQSLGWDARVLSLAKHFGSDNARFKRHATSIVQHLPNPESTAKCGSLSCENPSHPALLDVWKILERATFSFPENVAVETNGAASKTVTYSQLYDRSRHLNTYTMSLVFVLACMCGPSE